MSEITFLAIFRGNKWAIQNSISSTNEKQKYISMLVYLFNLSKNHNDIDWKHQLQPGAIFMVAVASAASSCGM